MIVPRPDVELVGVGARLQAAAHALRRQQAHAVEPAFVRQQRKEARRADGVVDPSGSRDDRAPDDGASEHVLGAGHLYRHRPPARRALIGDRDPGVRHSGDPRLVLRRQPHPQVLDAERRGDLVVHELAERPPPRIRPLDDLGDDPAPGVAVVGVGRARFEDRLHAGQRVHHPVVVGHLLWRDSRRHGRNPGAVAQAVAHRGLVLAVRRELRPVARYRRVVRDQPPFGLDVQRRGGDRLGHREDVEERLPVDHAARGLVGHPAPDVDDQILALIDGELDADLARANRFVHGRLEDLPGIRPRAAAALGEQPGLAQQAHDAEQAHAAGGVQEESAPRQGIDVTHGIQSWLVRRRRSSVSRS